MSIEFQKQDAHHESSALIAVNKGMVSHNADGIRCCEIYNVW